MSTPLEALTREIEEAFSSVPFPGDDQYALADTLDPAERQRVVEIYGGKRFCDWKARPLEAVQKGIHMPQIAFLSEAAFQYYLPLLMLASVLHYDKVDMIPHSVLCALTLPEGDRGLEERSSRRLRGFSPPQLEVALSFLRFMRERHGEDFPNFDFDAMIRYVGSFLPPTSRQPH